jgi:hypothetical protein
VAAHGKQLFLKEYKKSGMDFYDVEKQTRCEECAGRKENMALQRRRRGYLAWWGCTECPFEYPERPVPMADLEKAPEHACPIEGTDVGAILNSQER